MAREEGIFDGNGFYDDLIKKQYGEENYCKLYQKSMICAGTILGSANEIYDLKACHGFVEWEKGMRNLGFYTAVYKNGYIYWMTRDRTGILFSKNQYK